jgi:hypothetical protein
MMKIHKNGKKATVVMDWEDLLAIGMEMSESPNLKNRKVAVQLIEAMNDYNKRSEKKK